MLKGKIVWITGAGTGIGLAGAQALAKEGTIVIMSGRRADVLEGAASRIKKGGGKAETEPLDVGDPDAVQRVAEAIVKRHGKVDILVNSAGLNTTLRLWSDQTPEGFAKVIQVNLEGTFYCTKAVLPSMRAQKDGLIINVVSWSGIYTSMLAGTAYSASKRAVVSLTENLNMQECINGIRACALCPGEVATEILDGRPVPVSPEERARMLQKDDLGETIRWVATQPPHVCVNQMIISPTWNRGYIRALRS
jgi:NADP-dependent 3-hydroxy acid dehydrogenase YdfG